MPHRKKKSFIDKKNAVSFHLVHRSQRDPLAADEKAPQHVLLPANKVEVEKRREEQRNFGVFFDDDYNYLQHLRETQPPTELVASSSPRKAALPLPLPRRTEEGGSDDDEEEEEEEGEEMEMEVQVIPAASINLPSSVFASEFEEKVGLLNKAAPISGPRLDMDPDIVAALDEDFDYDDPENMLDDDFVVQANSAKATGDGGDDDDDEWEDTDEDESGEEEEEGDCDSMGGFSNEDEEGRREFLFMKEETRSRFTEYSLTSSVMRRNEQLTLLDDRFEKFFEQFDDDEIGALDNAELEGFINPDSERLKEVLKDYFKQKEQDCQKLDNLGPKELSAVNEEDEDEEDEEREMETIVVEAPQEKWDCETIISTYSNLYNRPKIIEEPPKQSKGAAIRVSGKTGIPLDVLPRRGPTAKQVERMERINDSDLPRAATQPRPRQEDKEERKARKQAIKEERKERRTEKKANKLAFKQEKAIQEKQMLGIRANVQGLKLS